MISSHHFDRLLHPFSPKGKLLNLGLEGLKVTNRLLDAAKKYDSSCVIRDKIYRIALLDKNVQQLRNAAELHPEFATWLEPEEIEKQCGTSCLGGIVLTNGCQVIHVPTYLQGLWEACKDLSDNIVWSVEHPDEVSDWKQRLSCFDTVVFSAGSGLFHDNILQKDAEEFPAELVRGQSLELSLSEFDASQFPNESILCGKYIAPLNTPGDVLVGATHEYNAQPLKEEEVIDELKQRSYDVSPFVWDNGSMKRITSGYRVQSRRGKYGRMPIIGKSQHCDVHENAFLFTGLSARGLIYHGIYGHLLSRAIAAQDDNVLLEDNPDLLWWKHKIN